MTIAMMVGNHFNRARHVNRYVKLGQFKQRVKFRNECSKKSERSKTSVAAEECGESLNSCVIWEGISFPGEK